MLQVASAWADRGKMGCEMCCVMVAEHFGCHGGGRAVLSAALASFHHLPAQRERREAEV